MKKLILMFVVMFGLSFMSCTNKLAKTESTDTTSVDTTVVDTTAVDSLDSTVCTL